MTRYFCDRCEKETDKFKSVELGLDMGPRSKYRYVSVCESCFDKVLQWFDKWIKGAK